MASIAEQFDTIWAILIVHRVIEAYDDPPYCHP